MRAIATTLALGVLLATHVAAPQGVPPNDPTENPSVEISPPGVDVGVVGIGIPEGHSTVDPSSSQMHFGSDESASSGPDGAGNSTDSPWIPVQTVTSGSLGLNWSWDGPFADDGSYSPGDGQVGGPDIEVVLPGIDATLAASRREKYFFDSKQGFAVYAMEGDITPGNCMFAYCMHLVFESDYGAMTPFDAFVLDNYESASGPMSFFTDQWSYGPSGGPPPVVLGRMSKETLAKLGTNWESVLNWKDPRRTTWTLHPTTDQANEIDLTLSLRQLYTYLPGYNGTSITSDGPFYSADLSDQVIIRVNAQIESAFAGSTAMLPTIVDHIGSQLVEISLTSSLLYKSDGVSGGNEMQLTFKLTRRKYGGALPWYPVATSPECQRCNELPTTNEFLLCVDKKVDGIRGIVDGKVNGVRAVVQDLLSYQNDRRSFDMKASAEACISQMLHSPTATAPWTSQFSGTEWTDTTPSIVDPWQNLRDVDAILRCWTDSQCNQASESIKADAQTVVLHHEPARTHIEFDKGQYSFSLQLALDDAPGTPTVTTQVLTSEMNTSALQTAIASVFPEGDKLALDVEVSKYDNEYEIKSIERNNQYLMDEYNKALQALSAGSSANPAQPQPPTPQPVPSPVFTLEIVFHNITVVPSVVAVYNGNGIWPHNSTDNVLRFEVADLDVNKFMYVPPPTSVDLTWSDEPAWMTDARRSLPQFDSTDACGRCSSQLEACLVDEDCAYGVNSYFANALSWDRLAGKLTTKVEGDWTSYTVDASETLLQARMFFPADGFGKLEELLQCMSVYLCNVDERRFEGTPMMEAAPTSLVYQGSRNQFIADVNEVVQVFNGPASYNFSIDGNAEHFQAFLHDVVFRWEPEHVRNMRVTTTNFGKSTAATTATGSSVQYTIEWNAVLSPMKVIFSRATSSATSSSGSLVMSTRRRSVSVVTSNPGISWSRLLSWLAVFRKVPFGSLPGGSIEYPDTSKPDPSNPVTPIPGSANPGASNPPTIRPTPAAPSYASPNQPMVCQPCASIIMGCALDVECSQAANKRLDDMVPSDSTVTNEYNGFYETLWNNNAFAYSYETDPVQRAKSEVHRNQYLAIMSCVAEYNCAVGYSTVADISTPMVPTTAKFMASRTVHVYTYPGWQSYLQFKKLTWTVNATSNFDEALDAIVTEYGEKISVSSESSTDNGINILKFSGSYQAIKDLSIWSGPMFGSDISYAGSFVSPTPVMPLWDGLRLWFTWAASTFANATTQDDVCAACLPKIQACYSNDECWRDIQTNVVPILKGNSPYYYASSSENESGYVYSVNLGSQLRPAIYWYFNPYISRRTAFLSSESWVAFREVLKCFAASGCDIETMESATMPPATAHFPSYLKYSPTHMDITIIEGSTIEAKGYSYTETGSGSVEGVETFFRNIADGSDLLPFTSSVQVVEGQPAGYRYNITFPDNYFGELPSWDYTVNIPPAQGNYGNGGWTVPWDLTIESVNQYPEWDKLLSLLSLTPPVGMGATLTTGTMGQPTPSYLYSCPNADILKRSCHQEFACWYLLNAYAIPMMASAMQPPANFNDDLNLFEVDLTATLVSQVMWKAGVDDASKTTLARYIYESTRCAVGSTRPVFQNARIKFTRPAQGPLQLEYHGETFEVDDQDTQVDGKVVFQNFFYENVMAGAGGGPEATVTWWKDNGVINYDIELTGLYTSPPPHLAWIDPVTGTRSESQDSQWRLSFQSPVFTIANDASGWLAWLGTQPSM